MGIKGLPKFIRIEAGDSVFEDKELKSFRKKKVAVDATLMIYQSGIATRSRGMDLVNKQGDITSHLSGIAYKILTMLSQGIIPIFVFDGKPPNIKQDTLDKRRCLKSQAEENMQKCLEDNNLEEFIKNFKKSFSPKDKDFKELQIMLDLMGIPYIIAPGEAEVVCSWLSSRRDENNKKYVEGVCTDDSDVLPLGASYMYKDMLNIMKNEKVVRGINRKAVLKKLGLNNKEFIDLCILLGCDYCDTLPGIGPKRSYALIQEHRSLEKIFAVLKKKNMVVPADLKKCMLQAREYYLNALPDLDNNKNFVLTEDNLELACYQHDNFIDFMCTKHDFDVFRIEQMIHRLDTYYYNLKVTRFNDKKVHEMIRPLSDEYIVDNKKRSPDKKTGTKKKK